MIISKFDEKLEIGKVYEVVESLGMFLYKGKYLGLAKRTRGWKAEVVAVFEKANSIDSGARFFSAVWVKQDCGFDLTRKPKIYLKSVYSGNSIETLDETTQFELIK